MLSVFENIAKHTRGQFERITELIGFKIGCLNVLTKTILERLYKFAEPSFELVAKYCMS